MERKVKEPEKVSPFDIFKKAGSFLEKAAFCSEGKQARVPGHTQYSFEGKLLRTHPLLRVCLYTLLMRGAHRRQERVVDLNWSYRKGYALSCGCWELKSGRVASTL